MNKAHEDDWRPVVGYEGVYEVSQAGQVRCICRDPKRHRKTPFTLRQNIGKGGYLGVFLFKSGRKVKYNVHRLVAEAFIGRRPDGLVVRHLNGNPQDNSLGNIAYGTQSQNVQDMIAHGRQKVGQMHGSAKLTESQAVYALRSGGSTSQVARDLGVTTSCIQHIRQRRSWKILHTEAA